MKIKTLLYGSQTSLGRHYKTKVGDATIDVHGKDDEQDLRFVVEASVGAGFDRVLCLDGVNHLSWIGRTPAEDQNILRRNVYMPYVLMDELLRTQCPPCRVVFVVSQTYRVAQRTTSLYCASKAGLAHMVKVMARELAPHGWIINGLAPGKIEDTKMAEMTDTQVEKLRGWSKADADKYALSNVPMKRFTNCEEVCQAIEWLFHAPAYINGTIIDMTGGA